MASSSIAYNYGGLDFNTPLINFNTPLIKARA
jgi:hypothetical protein